MELDNDVSVRGSDDCPVLVARIRIKMDHPLHHRINIGEARVLGAHASGGSDAMGPRVL